MKILVADDDAISRTVLQHLLIRWGHEPVSACDGVEALQIMRGEDPPKLLLLDWEMPKMDGLEVCRELRGMKTDEPPYIIFCHRQGFHFRNRARTRIWRLGLCQKTL
jgi:CheY-like chemotaxis protein